MLKSCWCTRRPWSRRTGTILIAEDDRDTMLFMKSLFEEFGYSVIQAFDGEDAVEKFSNNKDSINLLILDMIMPKKMARLLMSR